MHTCENTTSLTLPNIADLFSMHLSPVQTSRFSLTSLLTRVYGQEVFFDKFLLTGFVAHVQGMLLNIYLKTAFCWPKPQKYFLYTCHVSLGEQTSLVQKLA